MSVYELAILGSATPEQREQLTGTILNMVEDFDLVHGTHVKIHGPDTLHDRDIRASFSAAFSEETRTGNWTPFENLRTPACRSFRRSGLEVILEPTFQIFCRVQMDWSYRIVIPR